MDDKKVFKISGTKFRKLKELLEFITIGNYILRINQREKAYDLVFVESGTFSSTEVFGQYNNHTNELEINIKKIDSFPEIVKLKIRQALSKIEIKI